MGNLMNPSHTERDIRQFILDTLSDEDFEVFCTDYFRDALAEFSSGMSLWIKVLRLVENRLRRGIVDNLLVYFQSDL